MVYRTLRYTSILAFACLGLMANPAQAQSFLEKLEAAVRDQIKAPDASSEELPPPNTSPVPPRPPAPATTIEPTIDPVPTPSANTESNSGSIYLGLEAENSVGGGIGVRVAAVADGSPAWKAGFKEGDRILAVNGFAIAKLDNMVEQLAKTRPGDSVSFLISRGIRNLQLTAVLMDSGLASQLSMGNSPQTQPAEPAWLGVTVNDLTESFRRQFGIAVYRGAAVSGTTVGSPANRAGIRAGDAIIEAGGTPIENARDLTEWVATTRAGQQAQILYYRGGYSRSVVLVLEPNPNASPSSNILPRSSGNSSPFAGQPQTQPLTLQPPNEVPTPAPTTPDMPSILSKPVTPDASPSAREQEQASTIRELEDRNASLTQELQDTQARLRDTEQKLEKILQLLKER